MPDPLDSTTVRAWSAAAVTRLRAHRDEINALNIYPVPDSDTGSNLLATFAAADAAVQAVPGAPPDERQGAEAARLLAALAAGAAQGASGNSGFIASQILRGLAQAAAQAEAAGQVIDGTVLAAGLTRGAELGREAVVGPVEGTILTVARAAGAAARSAGPAAGSDEVIRAAYLGAQQALDRTPEQLPELAVAGVVDAGGRGLVVVLCALLECLTGESVDLEPVTGRPRHGPAPCGDPAGLGFEVQYVLSAPESAVVGLREALGALGDSVAVVPLGADQWNVHVHVDDVGAAIEAGVEVGRPQRISVVSFAEQAAAGPAAPMPTPTEPARPAVLAIAPGAGLAHLIEREGVRVIEGSAEYLPSVEEVLDAIAAAGAEELVLLPNASRVTGVAEQAAERARERGLRVAVVPTRSPVQGLAAIAVHDASRRFDDDVVAMAEAAAATRFAEVVLAEDEALTTVGRCRPGDTLGLIDGEVVEIGRGLLSVVFNLVDRLLGVGVELMTVLVGADAPARTGALVEAHVRERSPLTDVAVYEGGQPGQQVILGAE